MIIYNRAKESIKEKRYIQELPTTENHYYNILEEDKQNDNTNTQEQKTEQKKTRNYKKYLHKRKLKKTTWEIC